MSKSTKIIAALGVVAGLGVAALPMSSYAANTGDVKVEITVDSTISMTIDDADRDVTPLEKKKTMQNGATDESLTASIEVTTNDSDGYILTVKDKAGDGAALTAATAGNTDSIPAFTAKQTALATTTPGWGMKATNANTSATLGAAFDGGYGGVTDTDQTVVTVAGTAADDETVVTYGIVTKSDQVADTYSNIITYTVTAQ